MQSAVNASKKAPHHNAVGPRSSGAQISWVTSASCWSPVISGGYNMASASVAGARVDEVARCCVDLTTASLLVAILHDSQVGHGWPDVELLEHTIATGV